MNRPLSTSANLNSTWIRLKENPSEMGEDLPPQTINDPDVNLDMGGNLEHLDPVVAGHPEPGVSPGEKVHGINVAQ